MRSLRNNNGCRIAEWYDMRAEVAGFFPAPPFLTGHITEPVYVIVYLSNK